MGELYLNHFHLVIRNYSLKLIHKMNISEIEVELNFIYKQWHELSVSDRNKNLSQCHNK